MVKTEDGEQASCESCYTTETPWTCHLMINGPLTLQTSRNCKTLLSMELFVQASRTASPKVGARLGQFATLPTPLPTMVEDRFIFILFPPSFCMKELGLDSLGVTQALGLA